MMISKSRVSGQLLLLSCYKDSPVVNANSVDSDLTPCSVASDLVCTVCQSLFWARV